MTRPQSPYDWADIRQSILGGQPAQGVARLAEAAAPWRSKNDTLVRDEETPEALTRCAAFIATGRHAGWFDARLPALAEQGWTGALVTLGWRAALRADAQAAADYASALAGHATQAPAEISDVLNGGGRFFHWLAYDLSRRFALAPPVARPASGPIYFRGDMREVGVVGGADFTELDFDARS